MTKKLLPVGFYDLLFDEAEKNHRNINDALTTFLRAGYRLIRLPLVEFEENFSNTKIANSFRATDVISGKNLVFRNDITLQISRLLTTRLHEEILPMKLCYVGDVLCAKNDELYADRQQTQVGAEIIGCDEEKSNFEIVEILFAALKKLQLKNLLIEFSLPDFLEKFLHEKGIKNSFELRDAIMQKNISLIRKLAKEQAEAIIQIALSNSNLSEMAQKISFPQVQKAQRISGFMKKNFPEIEVRFDLFGDHKSSYHHELSFDVFCGDFSYPVARGGRYKIGKTDAVGATIYMNRLRKIL